MEWLDIESAPTDGTAVLAVIKGFQPVVVEWDDGAGWWYGEGYTPEESEWDYSTPYLLTHWMPLPPPPPPRGEIICKNL